MLPPGLRFDSYPQLAARLPGRGGGRSLLFNGHVDVVTDGSRRAELRDGRLHGRGAADMKGGVAAMVVAAAEAVAACGVALASWRSRAGSTPGSPAGAA